MNESTKDALTKAGFVPDARFNSTYTRLQRTPAPGHALVTDDVLINGDESCVTLHVTEEQIPRILHALTTPAAPTWVDDLQKHLAKVPTEEFLARSKDAGISLRPTTPYALTDEEREAITVAKSALESIRSEGVQKALKYADNYPSRVGLNDLVSGTFDVDVAAGEWGSSDYDATLRNLIARRESAPPEPANLAPDEYRELRSLAEAWQPQPGEVAINESRMGELVLRLLNARSAPPEPSFTEAQLARVRDVVEASIGRSVCLTTHQRDNIASTVITRLRGGAS